MKINLMIDSVIASGPRAAADQYDRVIKAALASQQDFGDRLDRANLTTAAIHRANETGERATTKGF